MAAEDVIKVEEAPYCAIHYKFLPNPPIKRFSCMKSNSIQCVFQSALQNKLHLVLCSVLSGMVCIARFLLWLTQQFPHEKIKACEVLHVQNNRKK